MDRSFGSSGVVEAFNRLPGHLGERTLGMAIGPRDEILVLGRAVENCGFMPECRVVFIVRRYASNGALDTTFGSNGSVVMPVPPIGPFDAMGAIEVGRDGKFVVAGMSGPDVTVARFEANGAPDSSFGGAGSVTTDFGGRDMAADVAIGPAGEVVLAGAREASPEGTLPLLARYRPDGSLDQSFGDGGFLLMNFAPSYSPRGLVLLGRGRIATGLSDCCYGGRAIVVRVLSNGDLDRTFAHRGWRSVGRLSPASVKTVVAGGGGRLIVVGAFRNRIFVARLLAGGGLDRAFGKRGAVWPGSTGGGRWAGVAVDRDGRIVVSVGGEVSPGFALLRLRPNGRLDRTFAGGTGARFPRPSPGITIGMGFQSSGRIVLLGEDASECFRTCPQPRTLIGRYMGGNSRARCRGRRANIVGTRDGEKIEGTRHRDVIQALGGNDRVHGRGGNDIVCGGEGDDRLSGGGGRDRLSGGPGRDEVSQ